MTIEVCGGDGGSGLVAFHRAKHAPRGGPSGGDGGNGGAVVLVANRAEDTLAGLRKRRVFRGENGQPGGIEKRKGRHGTELRVRVPIGTCVFDVTRAVKHGSGHLVGELVEDEQRLTVAVGGWGGSGNARFVSATSREPRLAEAGKQGVARRLKLELKMLVDVAFIGLPNAGKSSLLAVLSGARSKVAAHPFATTEPVKGVIQLAYRTLTAVDMPSLVEGAHTGKGLGNAFLRHVERAKVVAYVLDGSRTSPIDDLATTTREIALYSPDLARRSQVVVVNKLDLPGIAARRDEIEAGLRTAVGNEAPIVFVSATEGLGTASVVETLFDAFDAAERDAATEALSAGPAVAKAALPVLRPHQRAGAKGAVRVGEGFRITHSRAERIARGSDLDDWTVRLQYHGELTRLGVTRRLEELGIQPGDTVKVGDLEFQWQ